jgi:hypothetical protein
MSQVWVASIGWGQGDALVDPDQVDAQLLGLLEDRERDLRVVHPPRERRAVVVTHVVELERLRAELLDLPLHQFDRGPALQRVDRAPEDRPLRVAGGQFRALLPRRQPVPVQVGQRQRHRDEHVGVRLVVDHPPDLVRGPVVQELLGRQLRLVVRGEHGVEGVEVVREHLGGPAVGVLRVEVERVCHPVEDERVADHQLASSVLACWRR